MLPKHCKASWQRFQGSKVASHKCCEVGQTSILSAWSSCSGGQGPFLLKLSVLAVQGASERCTPCSRSRHGATPKPVQGNFQQAVLGLCARCSFPWNMPHVMFHHADSAVWQVQMFCFQVCRSTFTCSIWPPITTSKCICCMTNQGGHAPFEIQFQLCGVATSPHGGLP